MPIRNILLGVCGGVGAFKAVLLLRLLRKRGYDVQVVMTDSAARFVGEPTFHALTGRPVQRNLWALDRSQGGELHVDLSAWADAMIVYPATSNFVGGLAAGLADDLLKLVVACFSGPALVCPSMHSRMATDARHGRALDVLRETGIHVLPPVSGELANGEVGLGRLPEPEAAFEALLAAVATQDLAGWRVVVSAGPTREHLDPVRFLSNPSTGRMGIAVARVAARRGAAVTLVRGPTSEPSPAGVTVVDVVSASEMAQAVRDAAEEADVVVMAAAVADYTPVEVATEKVKKSPGASTVELRRTEDILAGLGADKAGRLLVGFAMETGDLVARAGDKLRRKNLDLIVANDLRVAGAGFAVDTNVVTLVHRDGRTEQLPRMSKDAVADALLDRIVPMLPSGDADR